MMKELKLHHQESLNSITTTLSDNITQTINMMQQTPDDNYNSNATTTQSLRNEINELRNLIMQLTAEKQTTTRKQKKHRKYCWTHGWCAHNGIECQAPSHGHVPTATLENK